MCEGVCVSVWVGVCCVSACVCLWDSSMVNIDHAVGRIMSHALISD